MESGSIIRAHAKGARHWDEKFPEFPEEQRKLNVQRNRLYIEGGHLIDAIISDILGKFGLGPLYSMLLRREGQKMMKATVMRPPWPEDPSSEDKQGSWVASTTRARGRLCGAE